MKGRVRILALSIFLSALGAWLFLGVFEDREFDSLYFFVKHRPSMKVFFFAPIGESDTPIEKLTPRLQKEEKAFCEFVYDGGGYYRKVRVWN